MTDVEECTAGLGICIIGKARKRQQICYLCGPRATGPHRHAIQRKIGITRPLCCAPPVIGSDIAIRPPSGSVHRKQRAGRRTVSSE
jgi:hypothetical protein